MVHSCLTSSTLLRAQQLTIPRTFLRYKSITAAIERGRQGGPDRPFRPRTRTSNNDGGDGPVTTRREARFEQFGPPRDDTGPRFKERLGVTPRSSRFGRIPRGDDAPSRFNEEQPSGFAADQPQRNFEEPVRKKTVGKWRLRENGVPFRPPSVHSLTKGGVLMPPWRVEQGKRDQKEELQRRAADHRRHRRLTNDRNDTRRERPERIVGKSYDSPFHTPRARDTADEGAHESRFPRRSGARRDEDSNSYTRQTRDSGDGRSFEPRVSRRPVPTDARRERGGWESSDASSGTRGEADTQRSFVRGPESLPYTTAASEFIYGHMSVVAAIKANRRKLYNLYVHSRGARDGLMSRIRAQKLFSITHQVGDEYLRALDKASSGRPHNGVILEASPLPVPPITELKTASIEDESFSVALDSQSAEDMLVNGKQELYSYKSGGWRHPLMLYVDGVVDEGNLGAIARSAYVLGADAIITPTHHTANWSHIAVKASAGAAEAIPLFKVGDATDFLKKSASAGWCIYASDAVPPAPSIASSTVDTIESGANKVVYTIAHSRKRLAAEHSPVAEHPTILMMGAEGTGLKTSLVNLARYKVGIPHGRDVNEIGVDSLNVSVAASILCYEMLQKPRTQPEREPENVVF